MYDLMYSLTIINQQYYLQTLNAMKIVLKLTHIKSNKTLHKKLGHYGGNVGKSKDCAFKKKSAILFYQTIIYYRCPFIHQ